MDWTHEVEEMIKQWGEDAQFSKILFEQSAHITSRYDKCLGIPLVIIGAVSASSIFIDSDIIYVRIGIGCFGLVLVIMSAIAELTGYKADTVRYRNAATSYGEIVFDIQEQLARPREQRVNVQDFVSRLKMSMRELKRTCQIPSGIFKKYVKNIDNHFSTLGIHTDRSTRAIHVGDTQVSAQESVSNPKEHVTVRIDTSPAQTKRELSLSGPMRELLTDRRVAYESHFS